MQTIGMIGGMCWEASIESERSDSGDLLPSREIASLRQQRNGDINDTHNR